MKHQGIKYTPFSDMVQRPTPVHSNTTSETIVARPSTKGRENQLSPKFRLRKSIDVNGNFRDSVNSSFFETSNEALFGQHS